MQSVTFGIIIAFLAVRFQIDVAYTDVIETHTQRLHVSQTEG